MNKAFFLDRDGTLNVDYNYVHKPREWTWCEGAIDALRWMQEQCFKIIVVTNQSGIARGRYSEQHVQDLHQWVDEKLAKQDLYIDDWYYAPHHPEHDPDKEYTPKDRKPGVGMFKKAATKHNIDFSSSYMAGDKITDLKPALELGITPFFIRSRHEPKQDKQWLHRHHISAFNNIGEVIDTLKSNN
ncbi:D-glycero-alpha-D-manno-heptose-1,7-bisphosphate 7-phosphatase [Fodinibius sp. SL11]|uniref:D-glycero-alpha-D-manno-heptose-1,7-bisphosphate 7-phosphatase n=1 Tax=Fodinibius sp. SL11 TaxID=3425690 RepID=UPI003F880BCC